MSGMILDDREQRRKLKCARGLGRLCLVFEISSFVKDYICRRGKK